MISRNFQIIWLGAIKYFYFDWNLMRIIQMLVFEKFEAIQWDRV